MNNKDEEESVLIKNLRSDEKLNENPGRKMEFVSMATMFLEDFAHNMYRTSIEMYDKIPYYSIDMWREFLNYPVVRKYIKVFVDEKIKANADQGLASGDKNSLGIRKVLEGSSNTDNSNIVLIRLPEKKDEWLE